MRRTVVQELCDQCWQRGNGAEVPAVDSIAFAADGVELRFDHCDEHKDPPWSVLRELAVRAVDPPTPPKRQQRRPYGSGRPRCDRCGRTFGSLRELAQHQTSHDELERCDDCGRLFDPGQSMTMHRVRAHGWRTADTKAAAAPQGGRRRRSR